MDTSKIVRLIIRHDDREHIVINNTSVRLVLSQSGHTLTVISEDSPGKADSVAKAEELYRGFDFWKDIRDSLDGLTFEAFMDRYVECKDCGTWSEESCNCYTRR